VCLLSFSKASFDVQELARFEKNMGRDYRLNYRLENACSNDVLQLCSDTCEGLRSGHACGGRVLRCLVEHQDDIKSDSCRHEVLYYIKMDVRQLSIGQH
jgi:hypothetical protein